MYSCYVTLSSYSKKLRKRGIDVPVVRESMRKAKKEHIATILSMMIANDMFRHENKPHEVIWNIFAKKQKERYRGLLGITSSEGENISRCYICSSYVGEGLHGLCEEWKIKSTGETVKSWRITRIFRSAGEGKTIKCGENFNIRICCHNCDERVSSCNMSDRIGGDVNISSSLAHHEAISYPIEAYCSYFQFYDGGTYGV